LEQQAVFRHDMGLKHGRAYVTLNNSKNNILNAQNVVNKRLNEQELVYGIAVNVELVLQEVHMSLELLKAKMLIKPFEGFKLVQNRG
jgi:hypothetical protein